MSRPHVEGIEVTSVSDLSMEASLHFCGMQFRSFDWASSDILL